jgi:hypothetical protein
MMQVLRDLFINRTPPVFVKQPLPSLYHGAEAAGSCPQAAEWYNHDVLQKFHQNNFMEVM